MEDSKTLDISLEDTKILPKINPILKNLPKLRRQSNNFTCNLADTAADADNSENLQSCGSVCVYNLKQQLIFNCEFCDLKYGDLDNFKRHLYEAHSLFQLEEEPVKENAAKKRQSSKVCTAVKKEPLEPPIDLPPTYFTEPLVSCGAVFIFNQQKFHLACGYCDCSKYDNLDMFEKHVKQQHNILEGSHNELNVVPKVEVKEEEFLKTEVVEPTEVKVEKEEPLEEDVLDIKQSYSDDEEEEDEDENEEGEDDEENEIDEDDEEFIDEHDEEFIDKDDEDEEGEEDEAEDEQNTSKAKKRKKQESPSGEPSTSSSAKTKRKSKYEEVECGICHKRLKSSSLPTHNKLHADNSGKMFDCLHCDKRFLRNMQLKIHMRIHSGEKPFECDVCQKRFRFQSNLTVHKIVHLGDNEKKFQCDQCEKKFLRHSYLQVHRKTHSEIRFECDMCDNKSYRNQQGLRYHQKTHIRESSKNDHCGHCDKKLITNAELINHERTHTKEKAFECNVCHERFSKRRALNIHKQFHLVDPGKMFQCEHCEKIFAYSSELKNHLKQYTKSFECDLCDYRVATTEQLEYHRTTHMGEAERVHNCEYCNKKFFLEAQLKKHTITHWSHKCELCYRRFQTLEKLNNHKNRHKEFERIFKCQHCNKNFTRKSLLDTHLRIHTGEKPFECEICHKRFTSHGNWYLHKKTHLKDAAKTIKCEYCDKKFIQKETLRRHVWKYHTKAQSKKS